MKVVSNHKVRLAGSALCAIAALSAASAQAAEVTDVFVPNAGASIGGQLSAGFVHSRATGRVSREAHCAAAAPGSLCPGGNAIVNQREFDFEASTNSLNVEATIGFDIGLELHARLPIVVGSNYRHRYATLVDGTNSNINPTLGRVQLDLNDFNDGGDAIYFNTYRYFDISESFTDADTRAGVADLVLGFDWLITSQARKSYLADIVFGFDYTAPIGKPMAAGNSGVGRGLHEFEFRLAASRQIGIFEPFLGITYSGNAAGGKNSLFGNGGSTQQYESPGHDIRADVGVLFHLLDDETTQHSVTLEVGGGFSYTTDGLDYTPLFEPMSTSACNGITPAETGRDSLNGTPYRPDPADTTAAQAACGWVHQQPGNADGVPGPNGTYSHNGLMLEEAHLGYHVGADLRARFHRNVGLHLGFEWRAEGNHFLSGATAGEDSSDENDFVDLDPASRERNANYNPTFDSVGQRFWIEGARELSINLGLDIFF